jgi:hypothetical protein
MTIETTKTKKKKKKKKQCYFISKKLMTWLGFKTLVLSLLLELFYWDLYIHKRNNINNGLKDEATKNEHNSPKQNIFN